MQEVNAVWLRACLPGRALDDSVQLLHVSPSRLGQVACSFPSTYILTLKFPALGDLRRSLVSCTSREQCHCRPLSAL